MERVLRDVQDCFELIHILPGWNRRGLQDVFEEGGFSMCWSGRHISLLSAPKCIRMMPEDRTNGFFVAMFQRKMQTSTSEGTEVLALKNSKGCSRKRRVHRGVMSRLHPFKRPHLQHKY